MTDPIVIGIAVGLVAGVGGILAIVFGRRRRLDEPKGAPVIPPAAASPASVPETATAPDPQPSPVAAAPPAPAAPMSAEPELLAPPDAVAIETAPQSEPAESTVEPLETVPEPPAVEATDQGVRPEDARELPPPAALPYEAGLVAPVELWIGDTRVVVKDGTRTHLQFRSYADSLLSALKEAKDETR